MPDEKDTQTPAQKQEHDRLMQLAAAGGQMAPKSLQDAFKNEETVTMVVPPPGVMLTLPDFTRVKINAGTVEIPKSIASHQYLRDHGCEVYNAAKHTAKVAPAFAPSGAVSLKTDNFSVLQQLIKMGCKPEDAVDAIEQLGPERAQAEWLLELQRREKVEQDGRDADEAEIAAESARTRRPVDEIRKERQQAQRAPQISQQPAHATISPKADNPPAADPSLKAEGSETAPVPGAVAATAGDDPTKDANGRKKQADPKAGTQAAK